MYIFFFFFISPSSLQLLPNHRAIVDSGSKSDDIKQARHAMNTTELLVQSLHLLGVWRSVIALFAIAGF